MKLRIKETLSEAFGNRFMGFALISILPSLYIIPVSIIGALIYNLVWLTFIRFTLIPIKKKKVAK